MEKNKGKVFGNKGEIIRESTKVTYIVNRLEFGISSLQIGIIWFVHDKLRKCNQFASYKTKYPGNIPPFIFPIP